MLLSLFHVSDKTKKIGENFVLVSPSKRAIFQSLGTIQKRGFQWQIHSDLQTWQENPFRLILDFFICHDMVKIYIIKRSSKDPTLSNFGKSSSRSARSSGKDNDDAQWMMGHDEDLLFIIMTCIKWALMMIMRNWWERNLWVGGSQCW